MNASYRLSMIPGVVFLLGMAALVSSRKSAQIWTVLANDPKGDAKDSSLADAAQLSYRYDQEQDLISFRIALYGQPNQQAFGVNIVVDTAAMKATK